MGKNTNKDKKKVTKRNNFIEPGTRRMMDVAYIRDGDIVHTGEALLLACLLKAQGKTRRGKREVEKVAQMLDDPNL